MGIQGFRFSNENNIEIWIKPLDNDAWALTFVNMSDQPIQLDYDWEKHNIGDDLNSKYVDMKKTKFTIRDLFNHKDLGDTSKHLQSVIQSHDVLMVKLDKKN